MKPKKKNVFTNGRREGREGKKAEKKKKANEHVTLSPQVISRWSRVSTEERRQILLVFLVYSYGRES